MANESGDLARGSRQYLAYDFESCSGLGEWFTRIDC